MTEPLDESVEGERRLVEQLERDLLDPGVRSDTDRLGALLHADFVEHGVSGRIWSRADILIELPLEDTATPTTTAHDMVSQHLTVDCILITYRTRSTLKEANRSSIWLHDAHDQRWRLRFHQGTPLRHSH